MLRDNASFVFNTVMKTVFPEQTIKINIVNVSFLERTCNGNLYFDRLSPSLVEGF